MENADRVGLMAVAVAVVATSATIPALADEADSTTSALSRLQAQATIGDSEAEGALQRYQELSTIEQEAFVRGLDQLASGTKPDQVPEAEVVNESESASATSVEARSGASWSAYCSQKVSLLGIVVTETRVDADFDTNGSSVMGIRNQRARVVKNYQPLTNVSIKEVRKELASGSGKARALVRVERGPIHNGQSQTENWETLAVNGQGKVTACKWSY